MDHLVIIPGLKEPSFAIYRDELPLWFGNADKLYGPGQCFSRELSAEESGLPLAELKRRWIEAKQPLPQSATAQSRTIENGILIEPTVLKKMLAWSLLCAGVIRKDQDFALALTQDGVVVQPR